MIKWSEAEVIVDQVLALHRIPMMGEDRIKLPRDICNALRAEGILKENEENVINGRDLSKSRRPYSVRQL